MLSQQGHRHWRPSSCHRRACGWGLAAHSSCLNLCPALTLLPRSLHLNSAISSVLGASVQPGQLGGVSCPVTAHQGGERFAAGHISSRRTPVWVGGGLSPSRLASGRSPSARSPSAALQGRYRSHCLSSGPSPSQGPALHMPCVCVFVCVFSLNAYSSL